MSEVATKTRLLDAAETLYAERGIDATSLRSITAAAAANLAAVHYHFGSKEALTEAVFTRKLAPLNDERLQLLEQHEVAAGDAPLPVETILETLILPALRMSRDPERGGEKFIRLMGRIYSEPGAYLRRLFAQQFEDVLHRFVVALQRALPELSPAELHWRLHFVIGAMVHTISDPAKLRDLTHGLCDSDDSEAVGARLVAFLAAGLRAPVAEPARKDAT